MIPAKPRSQTIKRVLLIASVLTLLFIGLYLSLFTTAAMPQDSRETATRALVLKHYRAKFLKPGDWVSAELPDYSGSNVLRRLGWIQQPDLSNIPRSRRKTTGNRMARKILEMDYKPPTLSQPAAQTPTNSSLFRNTAFAAKLFTFSKRPCQANTDWRTCLICTIF
jgi:hypothetical protein